jgi:hypothetical protein
MLFMEGIILEPSSFHDRCTVTHVKCEYNSENGVYYGI